MTKLLLCITLLAMSYIASADYPTYDLPLNDYPLLGDETDFLSQSCQTTDGKLYYGDMDEDTTASLLQVWDTTSKSASTAIDITNVKAQVSAFQSALGDNAHIQVALKCLGTSVYVALAYYNSTNSGIELFSVGSDAVTMIPLPLTFTDLAKDQKGYIAQICSTTDGKLYYPDGEKTEANVLQVWNSDSQSLDANISLTNLTQQITAFQADTGKTTRGTSAIQCIGTNPYNSLTYLNKTSKGNELFLIQSDSPIPTYNLSLNVVSESVDDYLAQSCQTADGKFYYIDGSADDASSWVLQQWDSSNQENSASASLSDVQSKITDFAANYHESVGLLQCIGSDVYYSIAYANDTTTGIRMFWLNKKSAGILSFSYVALFLALVALLL